MGWVLVMFDLPVVEKDERRGASRFRADLLDLGFFMLQESVYVKACVSHEKYEQHLRNVRKIAPEKGAISAFYITDKQWSASENMTLVRHKPKYGIDAGAEAAQQMTFW